VGVVVVKNPLFWLRILSVVAICLLGCRPYREPPAARAAEQPMPAKFVLDMADGNPGEPLPDSAFRDPQRLAGWGYTGQIVNGEVEGISTFDEIAPNVIAKDDPERAWADERTRALTEQIRKAHVVGVKCYAWMQVLVLPKSIAEKFKDQICDAQGRIDVGLPKTQEILRAQLSEIFDRLPELDGLVIRTGEIYLQALPYHTAGFSSKRGQTLAGTAIIHAENSHIAILKILRDEVCVKHNKLVVYRTWDFGNNFHVNPTYYLKVTDAIEPHANLLFSMKHQAGDFQQLTPFNPTIGIGKHRQIIEVQCQREAYGKGAHPYYIGQGVIDGWEEYQWMMKPDQPHGLRDVMSNPKVAGVWTWSRGGGWDGPYINNELWCELNAYVVAKFAEDPSRSEADIFEEFERHLGLAGEDLQRFRELNLLSEKAVLRGQLTTLGANIDVWWARDDTLSAPNLNDFIKKGLVEKALAEKHQAVEMWTRIEDLSKQIAFADPATRDFVVTSATYGRIKYAIIEQGWTILLYGRLGDTSGSFNRERISAAIAEYDRLWAEWKKLKAENPACSTLPKDRARSDRPGLGAAVEKYRKVLGAPVTQPAARAS
jgi:hypothetical protein